MNSGFMENPGQSGPMRVSILGSTGSIGCSALRVIRDHPGQFTVISLSANSSLDRLLEQVREFRPLRVALARHDCAALFREMLIKDNLNDIEVLAGSASLEELAVDSQVDTVILSIVGAAGVRPAYLAAASGKRLALANKEALVAGGELVMSAARSSGSEIIPVDSEHSAIFQCLSGGRRSEVKRIVLTASGGPFRTWEASRLGSITPAQALKHPNWDMGGKITVDSATLMNKGLEVIEARWLFDMNLSDISVVVHPQSIIHSMVEFIDGSLFAHMGVPDMRIPILYALTWPLRGESVDQSLHLDLLKCGPLTFEEPDMTKFPCLGLAMEALKRGGLYPAVLNGANEIAVEAFLRGGCGFTEIPIIVEKVMNQVGSASSVTCIDDVMTADQESRKAARLLTGMAALNLSGTVETEL